MLELLTSQRAVNVCLNTAIACLAGSVAAGYWLARASTQWAQRRRRWLAGCAALALAVALASGVAGLWLEAAAMADVPVGAALDAVKLVLGSTHYGVAWSIGLAALVAAGLMAALMRLHDWRGRKQLLVFAPLAAFWYAQAMTSHATSAGDFSLFVVAYWVHLALVCLWVGEVIVAGFVVLSARDGLGRPERDEFSIYIQSLSDSATVALAGIFATGLYLAWLTVGSVHGLVDNDYGRALLVKLALVGAAAAMGGYNRFFVMPGLLATTTSCDDRRTLSLRFGRVLHLEAAVLLSVLVVAAIISSSQPPGIGG